MVITPHTGEMATLLGIPRRAVMTDLLGSAREAACRLQAVVALKAQRPTSSARKAKRGSLMRAMSALRPQARAIRLPASSSACWGAARTPPNAAMWGVYLHGEAGKGLSHLHGHVGFLARELLDAIPRIMADLALVCDPPR